MTHQQSPMNSFVKCGALLAAGLALATPAGAASYVWQAYNDCSPSGSGTKTDTNYVSIYSVSVINRTNINGVPITTSGALKNFATGAALTPTVAFTSTNADANGSLGTNLFTAATPANNLFVVDATNKIDLTTAGTLHASTGGSFWYVDMTFSNLDPSRTYTFATTLNRDQSSYTTRWTKISISGADAMLNESKAGTSGSQSSIPNYFYNPGSLADYVSINSYNTTVGAIAEWTNINPGADGSFTIRFASPTLTSETGGATIAANDGYGPSAFMLALEVPEPSSLVLLGLSALACARRRRN